MTSVFSTSFGMGNSLQDQLLKAGLVTEEQIEKARTPKKPRRKKGGAKQKASRPAVDQRADKKANATIGDKSADGSSPSTAPQVPIEELNRQIRVLLDEHRVNDDTGDVPFYSIRHPARFV
ncbi:MAG: DUF2058 family protein, partial [Pseudomonadota bacterium]